VWVERIELTDVRNIREAALDLGPGLNVLVGSNAQGKTSVLEGVALLARARSFRTDETASIVRRGEACLGARGVSVSGGRRTRLEVELGRARRRLCVDGHDVPPRDYHGRLEAFVYSTDRLRVIRGAMRDRRLFLDRAGSALWPSYRQAVRDFERVLLQRNAALEQGGGDLAAWNERFSAIGARVRQRRAHYAARLREQLRTGFRPGGEVYGIEVRPEAAPTVEETERLLRAELDRRHHDERRARRSLVGPHRDHVGLTIDGEEASRGPSSGQGRSLLLALTLATLEVYRRERGEAAVALLDDLDSELDEERATELCRQLSERGQALVTTAHPAWARRLDALGRVFDVAGGRVTASPGVS
jgi:DNA replication and repair protein RecF